MKRYEYKVIPAPRRGEKSREAKTTEDRFALALTTLMNQLGRDGWEYVRSETLPCDERSGFTGTKTTEQNVLVFRRVTGAEPVPSLAVPAAKAGDAPRLGPASDSAAGAAPALGPADPLVEKG
jgi:hypothetical protein